MFSLTSGGLAIKEGSFDDITEEEAINLSIAKWASLVALTAKDGLHIEDNGSTTCALCSFSRRQRERIDRQDTSICSYCPVGMLTGQDSCHGSPYPKYLAAYASDNVTEIAMDEMEFLFMVRAVRQEQREDKAQFLVDERKVRSRKDDIRNEILQLEAELEDL